MNSKLWAENIIFILGVASLLFLVSCGSYIAPVANHQASSVAPSAISVSVLPSPALIVVWKTRAADGQVQ